MRATLNGVDVVMGQRIVTATIDGQRYEIPELWMVGYCRSHGGNALDAVRAWHEQEKMGEAVEAAGVDMTDEYVGDFALRVDDE